MADEFPHFESDDELEAWFDEADLRVEDLEPALEVEIGDSVEIVLDEPWAQVGVTSASSGVIESNVPT